MTDSTAPLASHYAEVNGLRIHSRIPAHPVPSAGKPTLVLVHGLVISSLYMVPTAERLAPFYPLYAPDLPGFGLSDKPRHVLDVREMADALAAWMDAVGLEHAVLAGPTMDPHARNAPAQVGRWLTDWTREPPSLAAAHVRDYYKAGLRRAYRTFRHALRDPVEEKLPRVRAPTLVVRGSLDRIVPRYWAEEAARLLPRGRLVEIPGGPHVVNYTTPLEFAHVVRHFVEGG